MLINFIIPIYNAEQFLPRMLDSILAQSHRNFEVFMVDDGSTDKTSQICHSYVQKDLRFKYFNEGHGGCSRALNIGMKHAMGGDSSYFAFVDADDELKPDYLEKLCAPIIADKQNYAIVMSGLEIEQSNGDFISHSHAGPLAQMQTKVLSGKQYIWHILARKIPVFLFQTRVSKLYHKDLFADGSIRSDEDMSISQDSHLNTMLLRKFVDDSLQVCLLSHCGYKYYRNPTSSVHQKRSYKKIKDGIRSNSETLSLRFELWRNLFSDDLDVRQGLQTALAIVSLSNAADIERNNLSKPEKKELYDSFLHKMPTGLDPDYREYSFSDRLIIRAVKNKSIWLIALVYKLRAIKSRFL